MNTTETTSQTEMNTEQAERYLTEKVHEFIKHYKRRAAECDTYPLGLRREEWEEQFCAFLGWL